VEADLRDPRVLIPRSSNDSPLPASIESDRGARRIPVRSIQAGGLLLPKVWDGAGARILQDAGLPAIGTTSAGIAYAPGPGDAERVLACGPGSTMENPLDKKYYVNANNNMNISTGLPRAVPVH
jgi:hypothetical protein